ncbi:MAG TPA: ATP-binding protein, partial [Thermoanaerobaculia bacterium]
AKVPAEATSAIESANAGEATKLYNQRFNRRDGSTLPVDLTVSPIVEDGIVIGRAVSFVDVSDRMRLEQQLEEAKRLSSLGRLAASIAHEINNVLMGILPFAEIVTRSKEQTFRNAGEQIRQSVQRGRGVTQEILRFARDEAPHRHVFEGRTWFRSIAGELQEIAGRRAWSLKLPDQPFHLNADPSQLAQVLINLVANARDAVDPASGRIEVSVTLANPGTTFSFGALPQRGHRWVAIRVTDNGAGMDADTLAHLFEPFFTKKRGGTGLGLPIAYKIVAAHEGLLFVESAEGKGSSFFLFLSEADAPARESAAAIEEESRLSGDVLLVEDDETVAAGLAHILEEAGMRVRIARNGTEAITELERARPTVMVLDVGLPDMHGEAVCAHALARWPGLPIVFSTGHAEASRLRTWLEQPNVRFLMKPYTFEQLSEAIGEAMNGKR